MYTSFLLILRILLYGTVLCASGASVLALAQRLSRERVKDIKIGHTNKNRWLKKHFLCIVFLSIFSHNLCWRSFFYQFIASSQHADVYIEFLHRKSGLVLFYHDLKSFELVRHIEKSISSSASKINIFFSFL